MVPKIDAEMVSVKAPWWCLKLMPRWCQWRCWCSMLPIARASIAGMMSGWGHFHKRSCIDIIFDGKIKTIYFQIFWNLKVKNIPYYQGGQFSTHLHSSIHQDDIRNPCHVFAFFTDTIAASLNGTPSQRPQQLGHHHGILIKWDTITASSLDRTPSRHPHYMRHHHGIFTKWYAITTSFQPLNWHWVWDPAWTSRRWLSFVPRWNAAWRWGIHWK